MKIGICVPAINLWDKFSKPALDSIKSKHELYFVFVDNGSTDNTMKEATKMISNNFHYKRNENNKGVSWAWNYAMKDCFINHGCDYCFIINNDVIFRPETIDKIVEEFERQPTEVVLITAMNVRDECEGNPANLFTLDLEKYDALERPESPDFSAFMVNRKFYEQVGESDEGFYPAYFEDNCLHRRVRLAGLNAIKCPGALYFHFGSRTRMEAKSGEMVVSHDSFDNSRKYFVEKWGGPPEPDGRLGARLWKHPFNDPEKNWTYTKQSENSK